MCCSLTELIRNLKAVSFTKQILFFSPSSCCVRGEKRKRIQADAVTQLLCRMQSTMKEVRLINPAGMCECIRINIIIIISDITCSSCFVFFLTSDSRSLWKTPHLVLTCARSALQVSVVHQIQRLEIRIFRFKMDNMWGG